MISLHPKNLKKKQKNQSFLWSTFCRFFLGEIKTQKEEKEEEENVSFSLSSLWLRWIGFSWTTSDQLYVVGAEA